MHDQHARIGRIALLWGQIDMIVDQLLGKTLGIDARLRKKLVGEKPIGAKLDLLKSEIENLKSEQAISAVKAFINLAHETKSKRNQCFHGIWGLRLKPNKTVTPAAQHWKGGNDPVTASQLPALEKKLCRTARLGYKALEAAANFPETGCNHLFHGPNDDPPEWFLQWREQHPVGDHDLDHRWKEGQLPYLGKPR